MDPAPDRSALSTPSRSCVPQSTRGVGPAGGRRVLASPATMGSEARAQSGRRRWAGRLALLAASALVGLFAAELALRALGVAPERWAQARSLERGDKRLVLDLYPDDPRDYFPIDLRDGAVRASYRERGLPEVDARFQRTPHGVDLRFGPELCRGGEIEAAPSGAARVVVVGDSFTEGQGVREEDTFAAHLGRALGDRAQVINCGRRGYDFPELRELFTRHLALAPDVVVYAMVLNDPQRSAAFTARQRYIDDWILDRRRMVSEGDGAPPPWTPRLFALVGDRLEGMRVGAETTRWYREMVSGENREGWEATLAHVEAMHAAMRERGGALVVALWPLLVELDGEYPFEATHRVIGEALEARSIAFVDALPAFRGRDAAALWVHPSDRHPNERAHEVFAGRVEPAVRASVERSGGRS